MSAFDMQETPKCEAEAKRAAFNERKPNDLDIVEHLKAKAAQKNIASKAILDAAMSMATPRHNIPLGKFACVGRFRDEFDVEYQKLLNYDAGLQICVMYDGKLGFTIVSEQHYQAMEHVRKGQLYQEFLNKQNEVEND